MPRETILLPTDGPLAPLSSIVFLSVLAHPNEREKREKFETATKAWIAKNGSNKAYHAKLSRNIYAIFRIVR